MILNSKFKFGVFAEQIAKLLLVLLQVRKGEEKPMYVKLKRGKAREKKNADAGMSKVKNRIYSSFLKITFRNIKSLIRARLREKGRGEKKFF